MPSSAYRYRGRGPRRPARSPADPGPRGAASKPAPPEHQREYSAAPHGPQPGPNGAAAGRLWDQYLELVHTTGVQAPSDRWYVIRAEQYIKANGALRLGQHTPGVTVRSPADMI